MRILINVIALIGNLALLIFLFYMHLSGQTEFKNSLELFAFWGIIITFLASIYSLFTNIVNGKLYFEAHRLDLQNRIIIKRIEQAELTEKLGKDRKA